MKKLLLLLLLAGLIPAEAQSGRVGPVSSASPSTAAGEEVSVKQLFEEANSYTRTKFVEFADKKIPYSAGLQTQTKKEQKQLAAKNAAIATQRTGLIGEDYYYLGLLHWISENLDGTDDALRKYLASAEPAAEKAQTARSITAVIAAKQSRFDDAEKMLADYLKSEPAKASERLRMESELAKAYKSSSNFVKMAPHAEQAYASAKAMIKDASSRARGLDEILDTGMLVYEAYSGAGDQAKADAALDEMKVAGTELQSPSFYYYAVDKKITFMIETGRKPAALDYYRSLIDTVAADFPIKTQQTDVLARLRRRDAQYKLLGSPAPELTTHDQWFPGKALTFAELKGKVVLVDFWAMWCGPCFEAFPAIREWQQDFGKDGFEVLGITRYYGLEVGAKDIPSEIELLKAFRIKNGLNYDFVVGKDQSLQVAYGAMALPTAALIDRKGNIRYIETGTSSTRLEEMRAVIIKLLAEK